MQEWIHFILGTKIVIKRYAMFWIIIIIIIIIHRSSPGCKMTALITWGVVRVVVLPIVSSIWAVCTSRVSNWFSNLSINAEICRERSDTKNNQMKASLTYFVSLGLCMCLCAAFYLLQVHAFQCSIHRLDHSRHRFGNLGKKYIKWSAEAPVVFFLLIQFVVIQDKIRDSWQGKA